MTYIYITSIPYFIINYIYYTLSRCVVFSLTPHTFPTSPVLNLLVCVDCVFSSPHTHSHTHTHGDTPPQLLCLCDALKHTPPEDTTPPLQGLVGASNLCLTLTFMKQKSFQSQHPSNHWTDHAGIYSISVQLMVCFGVQCNTFYHWTVNTCNELPHQVAEAA